MKNNTKIIPRIKIDLSHVVKKGNNHSEYYSNKTINACGKYNNKKSINNSKNRLTKATYGNNHKNEITKTSNSNGKMTYIYKTPKINRYVSHMNTNSVVLSNRYHLQNTSNIKSNHIHHNSYNIYQINNNYHNHLIENSKNDGIPFRHDYKYYIK